MVEVKLPVIVSIATVPSRIAHLRPTLESLLAGELAPTKIFIVRPEYCNWESSDYVTPSFLNDDAFCQGIIENVISKVDWGSGTKLLGSVDRLPDQCYLVLADDDVAYHPRFLLDIVRAQSAKHDFSFSYYTYRAGGLTFGQGCDGYSFYSPNLNGIEEFARKNVLGTSLMYHDDLWIGFFLFMKGITVKQVDPPIDGQLIYEQLIPNDVLSSQVSGNLARDQIFKESFPRLLRSNAVSTSKGFVRKVVYAYDGAGNLVSRVMARSKRALSRG